MVEPEFVLVDGPPTTIGPDGVGATVVDRAGRRGIERVDVMAGKLRPIPRRRIRTITSPYPSEGLGSSLC